MKSLAIIWLSLWVNLLCGQQYLYIQKQGKVPYKRLAVNDVLSLRTQDSKDWVEGKVTGISGKSVVINDVAYTLSDIEAMRTFNPLMKIGGTSLMAGGVLFSGLAVVNRLGSGDRPLLRNGQIITSAALLGTGGLLRWTSRKTYKKDKGWSFKVIDLENVE